MKDFNDFIMYVVILFTLLLLRNAFKQLKKQRNEFLDMYSNLVKVFNDSNAEIHSELNKVLNLLSKKRTYKKPHKKENEKKVDN